MEIFIAVLNTSEFGGENGHFWHSSSCSWLLLSEWKNGTMFEFSKKHETVNSTISPGNNNTHFQRKLCRKRQRKMCHRNHLRLIHGIIYRDGLWYPWWTYISSYFLPTTFLFTVSVTVFAPIGMTILGLSTECAKSFSCFDLRNSSFTPSRFGLLTTCFSPYIYFSPYIFFRIKKVHAFIIPQPQQASYGNRIENLLGIVEMGNVETMQMVTT